MRSHVQIAGLRELGEAMKGLSDDVVRRTSRAAVNAGAQVIRKRAVALAPQDTGNLKRNIIVRRQRQPSEGLTEESIVTVRMGKLTKKQAEAGRRDAFYARFVEFGTVKAPAQPFLRPAFDAGKEEAAAAIVAKLRERIERAK